MTTHDIEQQLSAIKPAEQPLLARRILDIPRRRQQRRRDCLVGFGGLLTGIAATLLITVLLAEPKVDTPTVVQYIAAVEEENVPEAPAKEYTQEEPIDLDAMIARYEKLLRIRSEYARQPIVVPRVLSEGVHPMEYRNKLLQMFMEPQT